MRKLLIIICLGIFVFSCSPIYKSNTNNNIIIADEFGQIHELQVHDFSKIPKDLLENLDKMGIDSSSMLNEYEGKYLNYIFNIDPKDFNLIGKKVGFTRSKIEYFNESRERFYSNSTIVGGSVLYIFETSQKSESGGYDAYITMWNKFLLPTEDIVKRLKGKQ